MIDLVARVITVKYFKILKEVKYYTPISHIYTYIYMTAFWLSGAGDKLN